MYLGDDKLDLPVLQQAFAIIANGDTHAAITNGDYVYVKNNTHSLADGLYRATANVAANGSVSSSNMTAVSNGGINALNNKITNTIKSLGSISASSSKTFTTTTYGKFLVFTIGGGNSQGAWIVNSQSSGTINIDTVYAGSVMSASSSATNKLTITNGGSTSPNVFAIAFSGSIE